MHSTEDVPLLTAGELPRLARLARASVNGVGVVLDMLIAAYGTALLLTVLAGGVDLGVVSLNNPAKPLLVLALAIPLRLSLPSTAWWRGAGVPIKRMTGAVVARLRTAPALVDVSCAVLVTSTFSFGVAFMANLLLPAARARGDMPFESEKFAQIFVAWDSAWYFDIARRGYFFSADAESSIAFFPLYPALMWLVAVPFGGTERALWSAGIAISLAAFVLALVALHRLTHKLCGDREVARRAVMYVAVFPFALFFTKVYTESLFLMMSVLAVSRAYDARWWAAGLFGAAATLTRPNGILIAVALGLLALRDGPSPRVLLQRAAGLLLLPAAFAGYCAYVYTLAGDPLAWLTAQSHWAYSLGHPPWQQLLKMIDRFADHGVYGYFFVTPMAPFRLFHGVVALMFLALTPAVFKRFGPPLGAYVLISLLVPLSSDALEGVGRYAAVLFPTFIVAATFKSARLHETLLIASALMLALLNCLFVTLYPIY